MMPVAAHSSAATDVRRLLLRKLFWHIALNADKSVDRAPAIQIWTDVSCSIDDPCNSANNVQTSSVNQNGDPAKRTMQNRYIEACAHGFGRAPH